MRVRDRRRAIWAGAQRLCAEAARGAAATARAAAPAVAANTAGAAMGDLARAPDWLGEASEARADRVRMLGAAAVAGRWRETIDGEVLRRAAAAVGSEALEALVENAPQDPVVRWEPAERAHPWALDRLGKRVLGALLADTPQLAGLVAGEDPGGPPAIEPRDALEIRKLFETVRRGAPS